MSNNSDNNPEESKKTNFITDLIYKNVVKYKTPICIGTGLLFISIIGFKRNKILGYLQSEKKKN